jgi:hypothetical protein
MTRYNTASSKAKPEAIQRIFIRLFVNQIFHVPLQPINHSDNYMATQSEKVLAEGLINTLQEMGYDFFSIQEEDNLYAILKYKLKNTIKKN